MGLMSEIDIEIKRSEALSFLWHEIQKLKKTTEMKTCHCGKRVFATEYYIIYEETGEGVCNECWLKHYYPFTKEFAGRG